MASEYEFVDEEPLDEESFAEGSEENAASEGRLWGNVLTGAAIGLLVGGGIALLFAPKRGSDLRSDLGDTVESLRDRAEKTLDELQEASADLLARSRQLVDQTRENLVRSVEAGREAYVQKKEELTTQMEMSDDDLSPASGI